MSGGTFNVSRTIWTHPAFADEPFTEREAFLWMVGEASWKPREVRIGSIVAHTERGQLAKSVRFMAQAWGWSKSRVDRFIKRLEKRDTIRTESGTGVLVITICDYDEFQAGSTDSGTAAGQQAGRERDSSGTAAGQTRRQSNQDKTESSERAPECDVLPFSDPVKAGRPARDPPKARIPDDAVPSDRDYAAAERRGLSREEADHEYERFKNHHIAKGSKFPRWDRAWLTWLDHPLRQQGRGRRDPGAEARAARAAEYARSRF